MANKDERERIDKEEMDLLDHERDPRVIKALAQIEKLEARIAHIKSELENQQANLSEEHYAKWLKMFPEPAYSIVLTARNSYHELLREYRRSVSSINDGDRDKLGGLRLISFHAKDLRDRLPQHYTLYHRQFCEFVDAHFDIVSECTVSHDVNHYPNKSTEDTIEEGYWTSAHYPNIAHIVEESVAATDIENYDTSTMHVDRATPSTIVQLFASDSASLPWKKGMTYYEEPVWMTYAFVRARPDPFHSLLGLEDDPDAEQNTPDY